MKTVAVVAFNTGAGRDQAEVRACLEASLSESFALTVVSAEGSALGPKVEAAIAELRPSLLVAFGGDGTVSRTAALARAHGLTLGIIPGGTANSVARELGIPEDLDEACACLREGQVRRIDVADVYPAGAEPRAMLLMATLGLHADTIVDTPRDAKRALGPIAYFATALEKLTDIAPFDAVLEAGSERVEAKLTALTVANLAPEHSVWAQGPAELDERDGLLDVTLLSADTALSVVAAGLHLYRSAREGEAADRDDIAMFRCARVRVDARPPQRVMVDGDDAGTTPVELVCERRALGVVVPSDRRPRGAAATAELAG